MTKQSIDGLNTLLRDEMSAVETYGQAMARVPEGQIRDVLALCEKDHQSRAKKLAARISELGGKPSRSAGPWGSFMKMIAAGAAALGERTAIAVLEEGEDFGLVSYKSALGKLDPASSEIIEHELLPAQMNTQQAIHDLKLELTQQML